MKDDDALRWQDPTAQVIAAALGVVCLFNALGNVFSPGFDATIWWIDLRALPDSIQLATPFVLGVLMLLAGIKPTMPPWRRVTTVLLLSLCALLVLGNALTFHALQAQNRIRPAIPIPFSLGVLLVLAILLRWLLLARPQLPWSRKSWTAACTTATLLSIAFPLAQMYCFGETDYRRHADVIIVFGCRAYADGRPSDALADRVRTACDLYHRGYAPTLLFTGGPGDGTIHETESMRRLAISLGVPQASILCDKHGLSTSASIDSTKRMLHTINARRVLVVSHFYHLPRIKLAYQRVGRDVYTVPAQERHTLRQLPYNMAREVAALWAYYLGLA